MPRIASAPHLFALAHGRDCAGPHRCALCGAPAAAPWSPPDSFTARDALAAPGSGFACAGCLLSTAATAGQSPDGKPWMWSWVLTADPPAAGRHALCAMLGGDRVRAGRTALRAVCLVPPSPPYAVALCPAGRTHTLYRSAVHRDGAGATLTLDGRAVRYDPAALADRLALCDRVARAFGVRAARDRLPIPAGRWSEGTAEDVAAWHALRDDPLTAAATCLFDDPPKPTSSPEASNSDG